MYNALEVSKYVVDKSIMINNAATNLRLQKLLYFLWLDYYRTTKEVLFDDEFSAWQFGPVVPDVYYKYAPYGGMRIDEIEPYNISLKDTAILDNLMDKYREIPTCKLVDMSHIEKGPWDQVYKNGAGSHLPIPAQIIKKFAEEE